MSWDVVEQTLQQMQKELFRAETPVEFQAVGTFASNALISLAQTVFRPDVHWRTEDPLPSVTDAKRQLESYFDVVLAGQSNAEARAHARSAVQLADALRHKRAATAMDAKLVVIGTESVVRVVALLEGRALPGEEIEWRGLEVGSRYYAWDGPRLHVLSDRPGIPAPESLTRAFKERGWDARFIFPVSLESHRASGFCQVFETDRKTWRRPLLHGDGQVLLVLPPAELDPK